MNIELNGVDPHGEDPPDELFYREDDINIELRRKSSGWTVHIRRAGGPAEVESFDDFTPAFCEFCRRAKVHDTRVKA